MPQIVFKLVFPPPHTSVEDEQRAAAIDNYLKLFEDFIKNHSFSIKEIKEQNLNENMEIISQFTELEVEVVAEYIVSKSNFLEAYKHLYTKWMDISQIWSQSPPKNYCKRPLLMLSNAKAFKRSSQSVHSNVLIKDVQFGIFPEPCEFMSFASLKNVANNLTSANFFHDRTNKVDIPFTFSYQDYLLTFSYKNIRRLTVSFHENTTIDLYLDLIHPPMFYNVVKKRSKKHGIYIVNERRIEVSNISRVIIGGANILKISFEKYDEVFNIISRVRFRCQSIPVYYSHIINIPNTRFNCPKDTRPNISFENFACEYLLTAIFQRNFSFAEQCQRITPYCMKELSNLALSFESKHIEMALVNILFAIDSGKYVFFPQALISLSTYFSKHKENVNFNHYILPEKSRLIRRVTITPTRWLLWPPEIMFENRVLRNYNPEFALRINFREDDMQRLSFNALYSDQQIFDYAIKLPMRNGIKIGERTFEFLGWSNSQIRDHGVWCYARDNIGNTVDDIRLWMGDFSHVKSVPKYMARMGQSFSQTEDTVSVPLSDKHVKFEDDIEGGLDPSNYKPYCFSDGVGKISKTLANQVHEALGHDKHCSAFQIRYGGCKGMLVIDPTLENTNIVFRQSMRKFQSPKNTQLEIAKTSAPIPLQLNRPFITLLNQLGVPPRIFLQLQESHLRKLTDILLDEEEAAKYLTSKTPLNTLDYNELSKSGIQLTMEPFFRFLLLSLHLYHVDNIKSRANIAIDPDDGRNMLGVLDETRTLNYGEVFVQYTKDIISGETTLNTKIVTGTVLVTKNPCMHPGDVRKFTAVDVPSLHHIVDCIVFPQKGPRPHPNEMAGSDLDGDEYAVIWKPELIFRTPNSTPADYPSFSASEKLTITKEDMINFLVEYIRNDQVGIIANAHLAQADLMGIHNSLCIAIAGKFSVVVDYAKSGVTRQLQPFERPTNFPDFMQKHFKESYESNRALGKLYRVCKDFEGAYLSVDYEYPEITVDPDLVFPGWEKYETEAVKSRDKYANLLSSVLQTYGIYHEAEAFSGSFTRVHCRFQERKDRAEVEKIVISSIKALCKNMKKEFVEETEKSLNCSSKCFTEINKIDINLLQKASAWYMVTYDRRDAIYFSFPWIVSKYLADIKIRKRSKLLYPISQMPLIDKIDAIILKNIASIPSLPHDAEVELNKWKFTSDKSAVELALRIIMNWAWNAYIITDEGLPNRGYLYRNVLARLFLLVIEKDFKKLKSYKSKYCSNNQWTFQSPALLCLAFFRFCIVLRFCNKDEVKHHLPFNVYKYKQLASQAMITYHDIAITGNFQIINIDYEDHGLVEMPQEYINISRLGNSIISVACLQKIEDDLRERSGVHEVKLSERTSIKKIIATATGNKEAVSYLQMIIRRESNKWQLLLR